jgi:hypothetical protein
MFITRTGEFTLGAMLLASQKHASDFNVTEVFE